MTGHHGVVGKALGDNLESETLQRENKVLGPIFVRSISLSGPSVEVPHCSVSQVGRVGRFVGHVPDVVENGQSVNHARGVPPPNRFIVGCCHRSFHGNSKSEHRSSVVGRNLNGVCGAVFTLDSNDAVVGRKIVRFSLVPRSPRLVQIPDGPVLPPIISNQHQCRVGTGRSQHGQQHAFTGLEVNDRGILNKPGFLILDEVGNKGGKIGLSFDGDALKHTTRPQRRGHDHVLDGVQPSPVLLTKTP